MTVEQEIAMQAQVNAHHRMLSKEDRALRYLLMDEGNRLVDRLVKRLVTFYNVDQVQQERTERAIGRAMRRAERRGIAYYGT